MLLIKWGSETCSCYPDYAEEHKNIHSFRSAWRSLAQSTVVPFALLTIGTATNAIYSHTPLVAFAAMSGVMLTRLQAIAVAGLIWLVNQAIGFGWRGYPLTGVAFTWGGLMGIGTLLVALLASWRPPFSQSTWVGHLLWSAIALVGGFVLYQGLILLAYPLISDGHFMEWTIVLRLFVKQGFGDQTPTWSGAIALGYNFLLWRTQSATRSKMNEN
jgi:hypothetical protein